MAYALKNSSTFTRLAAAALAGTGAATAFQTQGTTSHPGVPSGSSPSPWLRPFSAMAEAPSPKLGALDPQEFRPFKLIEKVKLTSNTMRYRFELPDNQTSGVNVASCLVTKAVLGSGPDAKPVVRPYTPTSPPDARGYLDLVVKAYPNGNMSRHFADLQVGESLEMKGPIPKYPYGPNSKKNIGLIAGGTGITPMLQLADAVLSNPEDKTQLTLIYANTTPGDIILKKQLDTLAAKHPDQFKVHYVVERPNWWGFFWKGLVGRMNTDMLAQLLPPPKKDTLIMVCGPPGMMEAISGNKAKDYSQGEVSGALGVMGYTTANVYKF